MAEADRAKNETEVEPKIPAKMKDPNQFVANSDAAIQQGEVANFVLRPSDVIQTIVDHSGKTCHLVKRITGESFRFIRALPEEKLRAQEKAHEKYLRCRRKRTMDNTVVVAELTLSSDEEVAPKEQEAVDQGSSDDFERERQLDEVREAEKEPEAKRVRDCEE